MLHDTDIIDRLGGTAKVMHLCKSTMRDGETITPSAISQWRRKGIPAGWRAYLREIRPDAFVDAQGQE